MKIWITRALDDDGILKWDVADDWVQIDGKVLTITDPSDGYMIDRLEGHQWHRTAEDALKYAVGWRDGCIANLRKVADKLELLRFDGEERLVTSAA